MLNPDGYTYSHTMDRFWSKNRGVSNVSDCIGVNLNRNFPSYWKYGPSDPCHRSYKGPFPASEPEVQSIVNYVQQKLENHTIMAISLHSFGQVFFLPYAGNENSQHPDYQVYL